MLLSNILISLLPTLTQAHTLPLISRHQPTPSSFPTANPSTQPSPPSLTPHILTSFPKGTWLENLVIRQADSNALVTLLSSPEVLLLSTTNNFPPRHIATIPQTLGCLGIVELYHDIFYIVAGNWTAHTGVSQPGSYSIWELDLTSYQAPDSPWAHHGPESPSEGRGDWEGGEGGGEVEGVKKRKVADVPGSGFLNGMTILNPVRGILLVADSLYGVVWSVNVRTGAMEVAVNDTSMAPLPGSALQLGINGLHIHSSYLYYDNTNRATFARIPIDLETGHATEPAGILLQSTTDIIFPDDFTIDFVGNVWMTADIWGQMDLLLNAAASPPVPSLPPLNSSSTANSTEGEDVTELEIVAGQKGNEQITGWTAAKFGTRREDVERGSLYVTTNGGPVNYYFGNWTSGGMLVGLDAGELGVYG